jgi:FAD/FMN-containing dehydrogenase
VFGSVTVPVSAADAITKAMEARRASRAGFGGSTCMLLCNAFGGAVGAVPSDATAFAHRKARYLCEFASEWPAARAQADAANRSWVRTLADAVRPVLGRGSYLNYADPGLPDWRRAYWGANVGRLEQVKRAVDPDRVFAGKQVV